MINSKIAVILIFCCCLFSGCISRLSRPEITGTVLNYQNNPVAGCKVGKTITDANGKFHLKEIRYSKFLMENRP